MAFPKYLQKSADEVFAMGGDCNSHPGYIVQNLNHYDKKKNSDFLTSFLEKKQKTEESINGTNSSNSSDFDKKIVAPHNPKAQYSQFKILPTYTKSKAPRGKVLGVSIGWQNPKHLLLQSVCSVTEGSLFEKKKIPKINGLYDLRMGPIDYEYKCQTCKGSVDTCPGHFGHHELPLPVYHISALDEIVSILRCVCYSCSRLLLPTSSIHYKRISAISDPHKRLTELAAISQRIEYCGDCHKKKKEYDKATARSKKRKTSKKSKDSDSDDDSDDDDDDENLKVIDDAKQYYDPLKDVEKNGCGTKQPVFVKVKTEIYCFTRSQKDVKKKSSSSSSSKTTTTTSSSSRSSKKSKTTSKRKKNSQSTRSDRSSKSSGSGSRKKSISISKKDLDIESDLLSSSDDDDNDDNNDHYEDDDNIPVGLAIKQKRKKRKLSVSSLTNDQDSHQEENVEIDSTEVEEEAIEGENVPEEDLTASLSVNNKSGMTTFKEKERLIVNKIKSEKKKCDKRIPFDPIIALNILKRIVEANYHILGFKIGSTRPEYTIMKYLPISPPCTRIATIGGNGNKNHGETDLTKHLKRIIMISNQLSIKLEAVEVTRDPLKEKQIPELYSKFQKAIAAYINNDIRGVTRITAHTKIPLKSLAQLWPKKHGRLRCHLAAKRVNFCARTVISPGIHLDLDQLGCPKLVAMKCTYPHFVTKYNIHEMRQLVQNGPDNYPGATSIIKENGEIIDLRYARPGKAASNLQVGMKVEAHLRDGDHVLFGRQPSLHKMSLMCLRVKIHTGNTFYLNLAVTKPYNADFDGDEMNLFVPQNEEARAEAKHLMKPELQINSPQDAACMGIIQDELMGGHTITRGDIFHTRNEVIDFASKMVYWKGHSQPNSGLPIPSVLIRDRYSDSAGAGASNISNTSNMTPLWTGKQCASMTFPNLLSSNNDDFCYSRAPLMKFVMHSKDVMNLEAVLKDEALLIDKSSMLLGRLDKFAIGPSRGGLVQNIVHDFGHEICRQYLSDSQRYFSYWISQYGFGMSIADCNRSKHKQVRLEMDRVIEKMSNWSHENPIVNESFTRTVLSQLRDKVGSIVKEPVLGYTNRYVDGVIAAGAKGNLVNYCQTNADLGQQMVSGDRPELSYFQRALPHFYPCEKDPRAQGFVDNSFMEGLTPIGNFFHAMGGREGLVDTASKTARVGYINRHLMRAMEDIKIAFDGTLRDTNAVVSFSYGGNGFDSTWIETQYYPCNIKNKNLLAIKYDARLKNLSSSILSESDLKVQLGKEFDKILNDVIMMRKIKLAFDSQKIDNEVKCPVAFARILSVARRGIINNNNNNNSNNNINKRKVVDVSYVLSRVDELIKYCRSQVKCVSALLVFEAVARLNLCVNNIVVEHQFDKNTFNDVLIQIKDKFHKALVQSGEMVGSIGGQSIGEPCLQMTLNTFHLAGVGVKSMTAGIPKMDEIIRVSRDVKKLKSASLDVFLEPEYQTREKAQELIKQIKPITLSKLIVDSETQVYWDPNPLETLIPEDEELVENYGMMIDESKETANLSSFIIRIVLDRNKCVSYGKTIDNITCRLRKLLPNGQHLWMKTDVNNKAWIIRLRVNLKSLDYQKFQKKKQPKKSLLSAITAGSVSLSYNEPQTVCHIMNMLTTYRIHGVPGISNAVMNTQKRLQFNESTLEMYSTGTHGESKDKELLIETKGTNYQAILNTQGVDWKRAISSNFIDIEKTIGINAATTWIIYELRRLFANNESYVNNAHLHTLANAISRSGSLVGLARNGYHQNHELGFLKKISFEKIIQNIMISAHTGGYDNLQNMRSNIMVGNPPPIGTNTCEILHNSKVEEARKYIILKNIKSLSKRVMAPLQNEDMIRFIPSLAKDPKFMHKLEKHGQAESYQYEMYKQSILDKNCLEVIPEYDKTTSSSSSSSSSDSSNSSNGRDTANTAISSKFRRSYKIPRSEYESSTYKFEFGNSNPFTTLVGSHPSVGASLLKNKNLEAYKNIISSDWKKAFDQVFSDEVQNHQEKCKLQFYHHPSYKFHPIILKNALNDEDDAVNLLMKNKRRKLSSAPVHKEKNKKMKKEAKEITKQSKEEKGSKGGELKRPITNRLPIEDLLDMSF